MASVSHKTPIAKLSSWIFCAAEARKKFLQKSSNILNDANFMENIKPYEKSDIPVKKYYSPLVSP